MQIQRATGSQGGYQADGQTAGSDLVDRKRQGSLWEGASVAPAFQSPSTCKQTHIRWHKYLMTHRNIKVHCKHIHWCWKLRLPVSFSLSYFLSFPFSLTHTYTTHKTYTGLLATVVTTKTQICPQPLCLRYILPGWMSTRAREWSDCGESGRSIGQTGMLALCLFESPLQMRRDSIVSGQAGLDGGINMRSV